MPMLLTMGERATIVGTNWHGGAFQLRSGDCRNKWNKLLGRIDGFCMLLPCPRARALFRLLEERQMGPEHVRYMRSEPKCGN